MTSNGDTEDGIKKLPRGPSRDCVPFSEHAGTSIGKFRDLFSFTEEDEALKMLESSTIPTVCIIYIIT